MRSLFTAAFALLLAVAAAVSTSGNRLLVVLDDVDQKDSYSEFFGQLKERKFDIQYETPRAEDLSLFNLGKRTFDHIVFLPTTVKALGPKLTPDILVDFVNAGGNILAALSGKAPASTSLVGLLSQLNITLPAERTGLVVDHLNYDDVSAPERHDVLVLDAPQNIRPGLKSYFELGQTVLSLPFSAGHSLGPSHLLHPVLRAPSTAYSYNPKEQTDTIEPGELFGAGRDLSLLSLFQARNSARVAVLGSADMLQDKWFKAKVARPGGGKKVVPANKELAKVLSGWVFQEIGVLRVNEVEHRLVGSNETNPSIYKIKNDVTYRISLSEHSWDKWTPFVLPDGDALQLEFSMLSPFHRLDLTLKGTDSDSATFSADFTVPDQHGIFNFKVNYKRPYLTSVDEKRTVSVRHVAHDEWPRSFVISAAWPWVGGIWVTVVGFLAFSFVWLFSKPAVVSQKKTN